MTFEQFKETYCLMCGTQRCGGPGSKWFEGCRHREELEVETTASKITLQSNKLTNSIRTQKFLRLVAQRLSGRNDCKRVQFRIHILPEKAISFEPDIYVYKDLHHRKDVDLFKIADLITRKYFPELILGKDNKGRMLIDTEKLNIGTYEYQLSVDGKRRRWVKRLEKRGTI